MRKRTTRRPSSVSSRMMSARRMGDFFGMLFRGEHMFYGNGCRRMGSRGEMAGRGGCGAWWMARGKGCGVPFSTGSQVSSGIRAAPLPWIPAFARKTEVGAGRTHCKLPSIVRTSRDTRNPGRGIKKLPSTERCLEITRRRETQSPRGGTAAILSQETRGPTEAGKKGLSPRPTASESPCRSTLPSAPSGTAWFGNTA